MRRVDFLGDRKSKREYREDARLHWSWIRLLLSDISITYEEARNMNPDDVHMLNAALDITEEQRKKKMNK